MKILLTIFILLGINSLSFADDRDSSFTMQINDDLNYKFNIFYSNEGNIDRISYYKVEIGQNNIQGSVINLTDDDYASYIEFDDYNFDGYQDMYVHDPCMVLGNCSGKIYLYNDGQFTHSKYFDDMTSVTSDPQTKTINSLNRSAAGTLFSNETYKWEGSKLVLVKRVSQDLDSSGDKMMYIYKEEERDEKGNMKVLKEEVLEEPRLD